MTDQEIVAGRGDITQASRTLGLNIYDTPLVGLQTFFSSSDTGQGSGAVAWLTGNFDGVGNDGAGSTEIAQLWDNNGTLGWILYWYYHGSLQASTSDATNLGQGPGALAWLTGNFTGSGLTSIAQPWDN